MVCLKIFAAFLAELQIYNENEKNEIDEKSSSTCSVSNNLLAEVA